MKTITLTDDEVDGLINTIEQRLELFQIPEGHLYDSLHDIKNKLE